MAQGPHLYRYKRGRRVAECVRCGCKRRAFNRGRTAVYGYRFGTSGAWRMDRPLCSPPAVNGWVKLNVRPPECDLCTRAAKWQHPKGGLRCDHCPRPAA